ncbi:MAG: hypothetical protein KatS3mg119_2109 [Rhodothalassiaceae bacterium]|nr:MAG: hypothetical protein KatS3mg119_2109 [Rhodothalassiaceae bacterium]
MRTSTMILAAAVLWAAPCAPVAAGGPDCGKLLDEAGGPGAALHRLFEEEWEARLAHDPFAATMAGDHRYDDRVPDASPGAWRRWNAANAKLLARLACIPQESLDERDRLNAALFRWMLENRLADARFRPWRIPFVSDSGFHSEPLFVIDAMPFAGEADYARYIARLARLPRFIRQNIANMRAGLASGFTMPRAVLEGALISFDRLAAPARADDSPFFRPLREMPREIPPDRREELAARGREVIERKVLPAYRALARFMHEEYLPRARETLGASALPDGREYYRQQIRRYTTLDLAPERIHEIGLAEVRRIRAEMEKVKEEAGFQGDLRAFFAFLRTDPRFYAKTPRALLEHAAWIAKRIDALLPAWFGRLPRMPYGVAPVPAEIAPNYTTGRYWPAIPGVRGGLFLVNTHALDKRPLYELPALTLHEAVPGHHLQISLARELEDVPRFRQELYISAFGEGWALYAEGLGAEMGIYETPYQRMGRLSYDMWRAARLVVDTGIHALGWSRARAIAFLEENTALSEHNIATEVDRYISWPAQALSYKLGELTIRRLRREAEQALGGDFDIRAFHDAVLAEGALPLPILEARIRDWIAARRQAEGRP